MKYARSSSSKRRPPQSPWTGAEPNIVFSLDVVQTPKRARTCGFGTKDRRPLQPACIVRLNAKFAGTDTPINTDDIDPSFLVCRCELWDPSFQTNLTMVRDPTTPITRFTKPSSSTGTDDGLSGVYLNPPSYQQQQPYAPSAPMNQQPNFYGNSPTLGEFGYPLLSDMALYSGPPVTPVPLGTWPDSDPFAYTMVNTPYQRSPEFVSPSVPLPFREGSLPRQFPQSPYASNVLGPLVFEVPAYLNNELKPTMSFMVPGPTQTRYAEALTSFDSIQVSPSISSIAGSRPPSGGSVASQSRLSHSIRSTSSGPSNMAMISSSSGGHGGMSASGGPLQSLDHQQPLDVHNLLGPTYASAMRLLDDKQNPGIFFVFQDLSVRTEGEFRLKMQLLCLASGGHPTRVMCETREVVTEAWSASFKVIPPKRFEGVPPSTPLSDAFHRQGVKISIRQSSGRSNKRGYDDPENGLDDDED